MTTQRMRAQDIVVQALRKIGVVAKDEPAQADDIADGVAQLGRMLKAWQNIGYSLWTAQEISIPATATVSVAITPRPIRVMSVNLKRGGIETPMQALTRDEYGSLPLKTSLGLPTTYFFDRQRDAARLFVWPVLAAVNGETFELTIERETDDLTDPTAFVDVPSEWFDAVVYCLADRLAPDYGISNGDVTARAERLLAEALATDREESVFFT